MRQPKSNVRTLDGFKDNSVASPPKRCPSALSRTEMRSRYRCAAFVFQRVTRRVSAERERQDVSAAAAGSDARRKRSVRSVSRIAVKPTMTLTHVRVSFIPTLKATSAEREALPRRV